MYSDIPDKNATVSPRGWLFYDAACPLCARWAERSRGLLRRRRIELLPLQGDGVAGRLGIPETDLLKEMRFLTRAGELSGGAAAAVRIARQFWWGWPLFALTRLPGVMPLLTRLYRGIARQRTCDAGICRVRRPVASSIWR